MWHAEDACEHVTEANWKMKPLDLGTSRALAILSTQMVTSLCEGGCWVTSCY